VPSQREKAARPVFWIEGRNNIAHLAFIVDVQSPTMPGWTIPRCRAS
jgi:hypothetical protein